MYRRKVMMEEHTWMAVESLALSVETEGREGGGGRQIQGTGPEDWIITQQQQRSSEVRDRLLYLLDVVAPPLPLFISTNTNYWPAVGFLSHS